MIDIRISNTLTEMKKTDTSFTETGFMGIPIRYKQDAVREIWFQAIELGMERGLDMASLDGQLIDINNNFQNDNQKKFYNEFLKLAEKYNCAIQYHPRYGMCVLEQEQK